MADDGSKQSNPWPLPKFYFKVIWDGREMSFQEVSGLDIQSEEIKYRHGDSPQFSVIKMPGLMKTGNVTMKKGVFTADNNFLNAFNSIRLNTIKRVPVTIQLLDETGKPEMTWTLTNAWPVKITGFNRKANSNEVTVETIELVHEGLTISNTA